MCSSRKPPNVSDVSLIQTEQRLPLVAGVYIVLNSTPHDKEIVDILNLVLQRDDVSYICKSDTI